MKIAVRNVIQHKSKTLIIGLLITIGITVLVTGNAIFQTASQSLENVFTQDYTGHVMVYGIPKEPLTSVSIFGPVGGSDPTLSTLPRYDKIIEYIDKAKGVAGYTPQVYGLGSIGTAEYTNIVAVFFGIAPDRYKSTFDNIIIEKGEFLKQDEEGIMINSRTVRLLKEINNLDVKTGDKLIINSIGKWGMKIRETTVKAFYEFKNSINYSLPIIFIDHQTLRSLMGLNLAGFGTVRLTPEESALLKSDETDILSQWDVDKLENSPGKTEEPVDPLSILHEKTAEDTETSWNYLLIKLNEPQQADTFIKDMNAWLSEQNIRARAQDWKQASGGLAKGAEDLQSLLNIIMFLTAVVTVIVIVNTLVITIIERIPEIGMMRAMGARKSFVRRLIAVETLTVFLFFGLLGIILGSLVVLLLHFTGIPATNPFFQLALGKDVLRPVITIGSLIRPVIFVLVMGLIAQYYPVHIAQKIQPVKAIQGE